MRILVVGAGAVGGYFGGRLQQAGGDVTFLVRERRAGQLRTTGIAIQSPLGDVTLPARTVTATTIDGPYDVVILACKAYDLDDAVASLTPAMGPHSAVLPLLNGMRHLDLLVERFGDARVMGGLCQIAATLDAEGRILHLNTMQTLTFGERDGRTSERVDALADLAGRARLDGGASTMIVHEMWEKWVFLSTLAGLTCLMRAPVGAVVKAGGAEIADHLFTEVRSIAAAAGFAPRTPIVERIRGIITDPGSTLTASMLRDIERGAPIEAEHIVGDLLRRAGGAAPTPHLLNVVYTHLRAYEIRRG